MPKLWGLVREQLLEEALRELLDCAERQAVELDADREGRSLKELQADGELPAEIVRARVALFS